MEKISKLENHKRPDEPDSLPQPITDTFLDLKSLKLIGLIAFGAVIILEIWERKWISVGFWIAMLILQVLIPRKFHGEKPVKWILVTIIVLLAIFQWWSYFSFVTR